MKFLNGRELKKISEIMDNLLNDPYIRVMHKQSGAFSDCTMHNYDDGVIDIELKFGIQDDTTSDVHIENFQIDRKTMTLMD